jgi:hypothetical protein
MPPRYRRPHQIGDESTHRTVCRPWASPFVGSHHIRATRCIWQSVPRERATLEHGCWFVSPRSPSRQPLSRRALTGGGMAGSARSRPVQTLTLVLSRAGRGCAAVERSGQVARVDAATLSLPPRETPPSGREAGELWSAPNWWTSGKGRFGGSGAWEGEEDWGEGVPQTSPGLIAPIPPQPVEESLIGLAICRTPDQH